MRAYKRFLLAARSGREEVSRADSEPVDGPLLNPFCICWKSATVPWRAVMVAPWAVVNQSGNVARAELVAIHAVSMKTPFHPALCCSMPRGRPATAPPTCAMHLTKPPADDERCDGVTSREKRPSSTWTGKAQKPTQA
eukprot:scaffold77907_cov30-Tisochrysis_lutea.AAC.3